MAEVSVLAAAERALQETQRRLFPIRGERWLALGFVAFLDQCGTGGGGSANFTNPGGGGRGEGGGGAEIREGLSRALGYLSSHIVVVMVLVAAVLVFGLAVAALILWLRSRATFMYIDNVETGRADVKRPWREHAGRASSYFAWFFAFTIAQLGLTLLLFVPMVWAIVDLVRHGANAGAIAAILVPVLLLIVMFIAAALLKAVLRDFVAPLQWYKGLSCGAALRVFRGLLAGHTSTFVVYFLAKIVYAFVAGGILMMMSCLLCCGLCLCCGLLPILQILAQPLFYFERRFSLELLHDLGYGLPAEPAAAPVPSAPAV
jgi:hypothetical protein